MNSMIPPEPVKMPLILKIIFLLIGCGIAVCVSIAIVKG